MQSKKLTAEKFNAVGEGHLPGHLGIFVTEVGSGELASKRPAAFASIKSLLRKPVADAMASREAASIHEFVDIWYSEPTWTNLQSITIR